MPINFTPVFLEFNSSLHTKHLQISPNTTPFGSQSPLHIATSHCPHSQAYSYQSSTTVSRLLTLLPLTMHWSTAAWNLARQLMLALNADWLAPHQGSLMFDLLGSLVLTSLFPQLSVLPYPSPSTLEFLFVSSSNPQGASNLNISSLTALTSPIISCCPVRQLKFIHKVLKVSYDLILVAIFSSFTRRSHIQLCVNYSFSTSEGRSEIYWCSKSEGRSQTSSPPPRSFLPRIINTPRRVLSFFPITHIIFQLPGISFLLSPHLILPPFPQSNPNTILTHNSQQ